MEDYSQLSQETSTRGSFLYAAPVLAPNSSLYARSSTGSNLREHQRTTLPISTFRLESGQCFQTEPDPAVKTEVSTSQHVREFQHPLIREQHQAVHHHHHQRQEQGRNGSSSDGEAIKAKIIAHPQYPKLVEAYMDCQGVGAPSEVATQLTAVRREFEIRQRSSATCREISKDPELDQFMEAYCDMLVKYRDELTRPLQEAMEFIRRIESQLNMLSHGPIQIFSSDDKFEGIDSSEEDQENSAGETELPEIGPQAGDKELKNHLLKKYSGYLSSLKQELSKKKKKGKLPKEARQKLLSWWEMHYKWPYPSETEKVALAEATGLDQKQINNWFINQRKRHWKPSEDMQFMVMDGIHPQSAAFYMEGNFMGGASFHLGQ